MNLATFGNFFGPDTLIIFLVVLLLFGAKKLPELARGMGQAVREFSKAKDDIEREVTRAPEPTRALYEPKPDVTTDYDHHSEVAGAEHSDTTIEPPYPEETKAVVNHGDATAATVPLPEVPGAVPSPAPHDPTRVA